VPVPLIACDSIYENQIEHSLWQAAGNVLPETAVLRSTGRIKKAIFSSLANPVASGGGCARYRVSSRPNGLIEKRLIWTTLALPDPRTIVSFSVSSSPTPNPEEGQHV
jgi:hypothetical protein